MLFDILILESRNICRRSGRKKIQYILWELEGINKKRTFYCMKSK